MVHDTFRLVVEKREEGGEGKNAKGEGRMGWDEAQGRDREQWWKKTMKNTGYDVQISIMGEGTLE
jgi:hypothetical protein